MSKTKKLSDKSPMELKVWEINSLQQTALKQEKEILYLKSRMIECDVDGITFTNDIDELRKANEQLKLQLSESERNRKYAEEEAKTLHIQLKKAKQDRYNLGEGM